MLYIFFIEMYEKGYSVCHHILQTVPDDLCVGNLMLGGVGSLKPEVVENFQITAVLSIIDSYMYDKYKIVDKLQQAGINRSLHIDFEDDEEVEIMDHFQPAHQFINKHLGQCNVLVHCQAGISRSATIVISYLMKYKNMTAEEATKFVRKTRYQISPNEGFSKSLELYESILLEEKKKNRKHGQVEFNEKSPFTDPTILTKFCHHIVCLDPDLPKTHQNLFLGQISAIRDYIFKNFQIQAVLTILDETHYKRMTVKEKLQHMNIKDHLWIILKDREDENILDIFQTGYEFIMKNIETKNVLVHCQVGVSRSASMVIAFLMKKFNMIFQDALAYTQNRRECVKPNQGFIKQLKLFEKQLEL